MENKYPNPIPFTIANYDLFQESDIARFWEDVNLGSAIFLGSALLMILSGIDNAPEPLKPIFESFSAPFFNHIASNIESRFLEPHLTNFLDWTLGIFESYPKPDPSDPQSGYQVLWDRIISKDPTLETDFPYSKENN